MRKKILIVVSVLVAICCILGVLLPIRTAFKKMETGDRIAMVLKAVSDTVGTIPLSEYNPVTETLKAFPSIPAKGGKILDAWGNPIKISIDESTDSFSVSIISAGPDAIMGTKDDYSRQVLIMKPGVIPGKL